MLLIKLFLVFFVCFIFCVFLFVELFLCEYSFSIFFLLMLGVYLRIKDIFIKLGFEMIK